MSQEARTSKQEDPHRYVVIADLVWNRTSKTTDAFGEEYPALLVACFVALLYRYTARNEISLRMLARVPADSPNYPGDAAILTWNLAENSTLLEVELQCRVRVAQFVKNAITACSHVELIPNPDIQQALGWVSVVSQGEAPTFLTIDLQGGLGRVVLENPGQDFDARMIQQMGKHLEILLAVGNRNLPLLSISLLSHEERECVIFHSNDTLKPYATQPVSNLFAEQTKRLPSAVALISGERTVSYKKLNEQANQLARYLKELGVSHEVPVGTCFDNSIRAVVAMLAILKAGGAFVPLDPNHPFDRLRDCVEDASVAVVITEAAFRDRVNFPGIPLVDLDDLQDCRTEDTADINGQNGPDSVAYISYTSGSTGKPVGVMNIQRSILNGLNETLFDPLNRNEVSCVNGSLAIGFHIMSLFRSLLSGVPVVILPPADYRDPLALARAVEQHRITTLVFVTPALRQMLSLGERLKHYLRTVRIIQVGGSDVTPDLVQRAAALLPEIQLRKAWGSTETGGMATAGLATVGASVGRPISNVHVYVLDSNLSPVPVGAKGELYVAADHLARGYVNRPELTESRFVVDPFQTPKRVPMYRTGDWGRLTWDGDVEFLGRKDDQVKVRGYRIHLGDVERALASHQDVLEGAVAAREIGKEKRLVAYIVRQPYSQLRSSLLRVHLAQHLPEYMIPSIFMFVDRLPTTDTGKIDRNALPAPEAVRPTLPTDYAPPSNREEIFLADLWSELLGIDSVGVNDHFLELGGDSLFAVQVVARVWDCYELELPVMSLFEHPTVAELATVIQRNSQ